MFKSLKRQLNSIKVKLFLWFWLVTICAIAATRFITLQVLEQSSEISLDAEDFKRIERFITITNNIQPTDFLSYIHSMREQRPLRRLSSHIIIKPLDQEVPIISLRRLHPKTIEFIDSRSFDQPRSWLFPDMQLTGPAKLTLDGNAYLIFYQRRVDNHRPFDFSFQSLPSWVRILTPIVVSFAFCWLLARSLSRPLSNVSRAAEQLGHGDLSVRVKHDDLRNDELGSLAKAFNQMADKLAANLTAHQRLLGDVSHELRSPLTRLQMALALAQSSKSEQDRSQYIERCEREVARLDQMLEHVLVLSRLENSVRSIERRPYPLAELLQSLVDDGNFLGQSKNISVSLETSSSPTLAIDQELIASAIGNIISNAVKYSDPDSEVHISLMEQEHSIFISVADSGKGVPESELDRLFEPFYRIDDARDRHSGGTGLGLAIAQQAILAHQGSIVAENLAGDGLKVTVTLPKQ
ncbi:ATP-binding protein [Colwellia sp. MEBiC06753]